MNYQHRCLGMSISVTLNLTLVAGCGGAGAEPSGNDVLGLGGVMSGGGKGQTPIGQGGAQPDGAAERGGANYGGTTNSGTTATPGGSTASGGVPAGGVINAGGGSSNGGGESGGRSIGGAVNGGASPTGGNGTGTGGATAVGGAAGVASNVGGNAPGGSVSVGGAQGGSDVGGFAGTSGKLIRNDVFWKDTSGTPIYSQGGGVLLVGDTYYWYGVKYNGAVTYAANPVAKNSDTSFAGVTIYSSKDLATWKLENTVKFGNAGGWFGRLGVVYHANTKKYVLIAQGAGGLFFATSSTPTGDFTFNNVQTNLSGITNGGTGDQTTFQDDDGKAYLICSSVSGRSHQYVVPLRTSDYLAIGTPVEIAKGKGREGNAMFKYNGRYYFCSSDLHGWNTSQTYCMSATNILGPYGPEFVMRNTERDYSHVTQTGFFITVKGSAQPLVIFAGDRWSDFAGNGIGYNQWMPLTFEGTSPIFQSVSEWSLDVATGKWSVGPDNNYALNPSFEADRISVTKPVGWATSNGTNVAGGHTGRWSWRLSGASSLDQTVSNLPNGTYTLSAWVKGSGAGGAVLYAKGSGGADRSTSLAGANGNWSKISLPEIVVSNGQSRIGVTTTTGTITVDDFVLDKN